MVMVVTLSPEADSAGQSLCSLQFASRVRGMTLGQAKRQVSAGADVAALQAELAAQAHQVRRPWPRRCLHSAGRSWRWSSRARIGTWQALAAVQRQAHALGGAQVARWKSEAARLQRLVDHQGKGAPAQTPRRGALSHRCGAAVEPAAFLAQWLGSRRGA